ncbi:MAG: cytochrome c, partial [bacterium]|nr:cytochrome c [bacterium]
MKHSIYLPLRSLTFSVALAALAAGCTRAPDLVYSTSELTEKLPSAHTTQIETELGLYFGSPVDPRLSIVADEQPESEDDEEEVELLLEDVIDRDQLAHGASVFNRRCAGCHGITGDGNGEAAPFLQPKPRDYRRGTFKFTSTPFGAKPRRSDLIQIIRKGAKGTSMPSFKFLPDEDLAAVSDYVIMLSYRGELEMKVSQIAEFDYEEDEEIDKEDFTDMLEDIHKSWERAKFKAVLPVSAQPKMTDETILAGRKAFLSKGCSQCHGTDFRGQTEWLSHEFIAAQEAKPDGERIKINYDDWGDPAPAADLTAGSLHGGRRPIDIYRRIYTGINGTPMPSFGQTLASEP